jgi:hypothetical protein
MIKQQHQLHLRSFSGDNLTSKTHNESFTSSVNNTLTSTGTVRHAHNETVMTRLTSGADLKASAVTQPPSKCLDRSGPGESPASSAKGKGLEGENRRLPKASSPASTHSKAARKKKDKCTRCCAIV